MQSLHKLCKCKNITRNSQFLGPGKKGENMILYNSQLENEDETKGRKLALSPMISFILTLVRLRRTLIKNISCIYLKL